MRVALDGTEIDVPGATTLGELLEGMRPHIDPERLVTLIEVDGAAADASNGQALAAWRLGGGERVRIGTETPDEFAHSRRGEISGHLARIADLLGAVANGLVTGLTTDANRVLAAAARELGLVLELDQQLARLEGTVPGCARVVAAVDRIGDRLTAAERDKRWQEVAELLRDELVPALRG